MFSMALTLWAPDGAKNNLIFFWSTENLESLDLITADWSWNAIYPKVTFHVFYGTFYIIAIMRFRIGLSRQTIDCYQYVNWLDVFVSLIGIGPVKSKWISALSSVNLGSVPKSFLAINGLRVLPFRMQFRNRLSESQSSSFYRETKED